MGPYSLLSLLGEGGQGAVYLGQDESGARVAIKILHARMATDEESRRRFLREVEAARKVGPFSTARVLDADITGHQPYIVSEYVDGESLQELIRRDGPRDAGGLRRLALATAAALQAIHQAGIVHRDFKPSNILLGSDGPRVVDFGIARALEGTSVSSSGVLGTPMYMSPEQVSGAVVGPASDVFSWGITMVYAATGRPAFGQDSIPAVLNRILSHDPDLDGLPDDMRGLITECLAKDPRDRPSADELLQRILRQSDARQAGQEGTGDDVRRQITVAVRRRDTPADDVRPAAPTHRRPFLLAFFLQLAAGAGTYLLAYRVGYGQDTYGDNFLPWVRPDFWPYMFGCLGLTTVVAIVLRVAAWRARRKAPKEEQVSS
ncbi:serine/threonine-protein kinase [Acrocarpospora catenulata]|uniref:serine/threonine-protein kinase n=1 Tax=Acrocarpospora catenulata TaxID=2836182 RepID=UPI001BD99DFD|nr:serine/threonine-protein kinase [Acrocarpospora catenulata]